MSRKYQIEMIRKGGNERRLFTVEAENKQDAWEEALNKGFEKDFRLLKGSIRLLHFPKKK